MNDNVLRNVRNWVAGQQLRLGLSDRELATRAGVPLVFLVSLRSGLPLSLLHEARLDEYLKRIGTACGGDIIGAFRVAEFIPPADPELSRAEQTESDLQFLINRIPPEGRKALWVKAKAMTEKHFRVSLRQQLEDIRKAIFQGEEMP